MTRHSLTNETARSNRGNTQEKIVVVGQGAIGLLYYHHLQQARNQVSLLSKEFSSEYLNSEKSSVSAKSSRVEYSYTAHQTTVARSYPLAYAQVADVKQADIIIVCVKSYQVVRVIKLIAKLIKSTCLVVLAHNGMGTLAETATLLPDSQRILAMLTTHGCLRNSPLNITHTGLGHSELGLLSGTMTELEKSELILLLNMAMPSCTFEANITNKQWIKLTINCLINPITAINNIENGQVNLTKFTAIRAKLIDEIIAIARTEGIYFTHEQLAETVRAVAQATAKNSSSMRCDILAKRQTEIDYINGYIHRLGVKHGIATPTNTQVWQAVKKMEQSS
jgi:2-dehydropantoate 2-reductase